MAMLLSKYLRNQLVEIQMTNYNSRELDSGKPTKISLRIANICYANVSALFATYCNAHLHGGHFKWENFKDMCVHNADLWLLTHNVKRSDDNIEMARQYAGEIADRLVQILREEGNLKCQIMN